MTLVIPFLAALLALVIRGSAVVIKPPVAPRGWNSWDSQGSAFNESTLNGIADVMASKLLPYGYEYLVADEYWFGSTRVVDEYGRLVPSPSQFPSTASTHSFSPIASALASKGLKFGIWYMAGVTQEALAANSPIKGTNYTVKDIATSESYCPAWDNGWGFRVNHSHPAAQAWYDSHAELWSEWGVSYVKMDCAFAYNEYPDHRLDIIRMHAALDKQDTTFVYSLSPGASATIGQATAIRQFATTFRVTGDFWDEEQDLYMLHFDTARDMVSSVIREEGKGSYIDLDMLPFGRIGQPGVGCSPPEGCPRHTRFTEAEQRTIMALWSIAQSILVIGADLTVADPFTLDLLTNKALLGMTADIEHPFESLRQNVTDVGSFVLWQGGSRSAPGATYGCLFNTVNTTATYDVLWASMGVMDTTTSCQWNDLLSGSGPVPCGQSLSLEVGPHDVRVFQVRV